MNKKIVSFLAVVCTGLSNAYATSLASPGYYDVPKTDEFLGLTNMNKEFKVTSLMNSAIINDYKAAEIFINTGANVNDRNIANVTPLHLASRNAAHETAQILLRYGAIVDPKDNENWTPLMRASLAGDLEMIKILMGYGANAWNQNNYGDTPVVHAAMADCYECVKYILENAGENPYPTMLNTQLQKALDIANKRYNEAMIRLLKEQMDGKNGYGSNKYGNGKFNTGDNDNLNPYGDGSMQNGQYGQYGIDGTNTLVELVYIFMGRTISAQEIAAMGKQAYINSRSSYYDRTPMTRSQIHCSPTLQNCKKVTLVNTNEYNNNNTSTSYTNNGYTLVNTSNNVTTSKNINNNSYTSSDLGNNTSNSKKGYTLKSPNNSMQFNGVNNLNNSPKTYKYTPKNINITPQPNYNNVNYNNNDVMVLTIE